MDKEPHRREPPEYAPPGQEYAQPGRECADLGLEQQPEEPTGNHYTAPRQEKHRHEREALLRTLLLGAVTVTVAAAAVTNPGLQWKDTGAEQIQTTPIPTATSTPTAEPTPELTAEPTATPAPTRTPKPEFTPMPPLNGISLNPPEPVLAYVFDMTEEGVEAYEFRVLFPFDTTTYISESDGSGETVYASSFIVYGGGPNDFDELIHIYPYGRLEPEDEDDPQLVETYAPYRTTAFIAIYPEGENEDDGIRGYSPYYDPNGNTFNYDPFGGTTYEYAAFCYQTKGVDKPLIMKIDSPAGDHYETRTYRYDMASLPHIGRTEFIERTTQYQSGKCQPALAQ